MTNKKTVALVSLATFTTIGNVLMGCAHTGGEPSNQAQAALPPAAVQATAPQRRSVSRLISLPGDVHPWEETTLYAKVPGYLATITVDKGDRVKAGQVVATIQAPELQADRAQAQQTYQSALAAANGSLAADERTVVEGRRMRSAEDKARADFAQMTVAIARAKAQLKTSQGAVNQAEEQKNESLAVQAESEAQVEKARADLEGARADQKLADVTYERYQGIYDKNPMLLAKQDLDVAESRARAARSKTQAAQSAVNVSQRHVQAAEAQVKAAKSKIEQSQSEVEAAQDQVSMMVAQQTSGQMLVNIAKQDVAMSAKQQGVTQARARETRSQAGAGLSALSKTTVFAAYASIHAPFSGIVTKRFVDRGAFIQTASTNLNAAPIVTIANLNTVRVYINVPEIEAGFVGVGTPVKIILTSAPTAPITGRIARTTGTLDTKSRTLQVEADLPNLDGKILPGAYATTKVVLETHPDVLSVPSPAVGTEKAGKFVFTVEGGKAKRVAVTTGFNDGAFTEILTGLKGGEQVIVTGRDTLTPGAPVTVTPWTPAAKALPGKK